MSVRIVEILEMVNIHKDKFQDAVFEILSCEAPISERSFLKRIVGFFDRERRSKIVRQEYEERMVNCENKGIIRRDGFLNHKNDALYDHNQVYIYLCNLLYFLLNYKFHRNSVYDCKNVELIQDDSYLIRRFFHIFLLFICFFCF